MEDESGEIFKWIHDLKWMKELIYDHGGVESASKPEKVNTRNEKPDICLTPEEIARLQAIYIANIQYRRQAAR